MDGCTSCGRDASGYPLTLAHFCPACGNSGSPDVFANFPAGPKSPRASLLATRSAEVVALLDEARSRAIRELGAVSELFTKMGRGYAR